jgi:3'(2'), 5'-bisphosphate nucleotidase
MQNLPSPLMASLLDLALSAGRAIMAVYGGVAEARLKDDATPVTQADLAAESVILAGLAKLAPEIPVISEEGALPEADHPHLDRFFLVDPLDGTKEFLSRNGEFTVNIALIENEAATAGIVLAPALPRLFWAETGYGAFEAAVSQNLSMVDPVHRRLLAAPLPPRGLRVIASRSHLDPSTEEWLRSRDVSAFLSAGSSLKFCLVAAGEADVYPRFGRTMEWDTAAGHAILAAAGGKVLCPDGRPLAYGKRSEAFANSAFIASGP